MLRRVTATTALKQSTNSPSTTPTKKRGLSKISASPSSNRFSEVYVRELRDPLDHSLVAITIEGAYPINTFLSGANPVEEEDGTLLYVPATGFPPLHRVYSITTSSLRDASVQEGCRRPAFS